MVNERSLKWYHENKDKIDRKKKKAYMKEYRLRNLDKWKRTPEQQAKVNARRRERYAQDPEFRKREIEQSKKYRQDNLHKKYAYELKTKYNLTVEEYEQMLVKQEGKCAICGRSENVDLFKSRGKIKLHVDHCHKTGVVRGILCSSCNLGIGKFRDDPQLLLNASIYLNTFQGVLNNEETA